MAAVELKGEHFAAAVRVFLDPEQRADARAAIERARSRDDLTDTEQERVAIYAAALDYAEKIERDYGGTWFGGPSRRVEPIRLSRLPRPVLRSTRPRGTTRAFRPRRRSRRSRAPASDRSEPSRPSHHIASPGRAA